MAVCLMFRQHSRQYIMLLSSGSHFVCTGLQVEEVFQFHVVTQHRDFKIRWQF